MNKSIFGGPAQPVKTTPTPPPKSNHQESDYTARVNVSNEFSSSNGTSNNDDYSTVRLTTSPSQTQPKKTPQQNQQNEDNYSKVVMKTNATGSKDESDYNVINFNKQSKDQDIYLNNKKT